MKATEFMEHAGDAVGAYLFTGSEQWRKDEAVQRLKALLLPQGLDELNFERFEGKIEMSRVAAAIETLPLMAERRVIEVRTNSMTVGETETLLGYAEKLPSYIVLIVCTEGESKQNGELVKGGFTEVKFDSLSERELARYVSQITKSGSVEWPLQIIQDLIDYVGTDAQILRNETLKLMDYLDAGTVPTHEDIAQACIKSTEYGVFVMLDSFFGGFTARGIELLTGLLDEGEPPLKLNALVVSRLRTMISLRCLVAGGMSEKEACMKAGGQRESANRRTLSASKKLPLDRLFRAYHLAARCDVKLKLGELPPRVELERTMAEIFCQ